MERVIIRFLSGAQANQERSFNASELVQGLTIGRDPNSRISIDETEDAVSRQHAKIEADTERSYGFWVADLNSRNGVYVNGSRVEGRAKLEHGDIVRLGLGGPEFSVLADPPPPAALKPTRVVNIVPEPSPTREVRTEAAGATPSDISEPPRNIGRATVERMIGEQKKSSGKRLIQLGILVVAVIAVVAGWLFYQSRETERKAAGEKALLEANAQQLQTKVEAARRIADTYGQATVFIEVAWKLIDTTSGKQVFHSYLPKQRTENGKETQSLPLYVKMQDETLEPLVALDDNRGLNKAIGGSGTGSGFVVSENGFILTNKHVAAGWNIPYSLPFPGLIVAPDGRGGIKIVSEIQKATGGLEKWVPARAALMGGKSFEFKKLEGRVDILDVTFPKNKLRIPAHITRISSEHDVALIKIDTPAPLKKVELWDNYESIRAGDTVVLLGYPAISPMGIVVTRSREMNTANRGELTIIPDITVNQGIISKVVHGSGTQIVEGGTPMDYYSPSGDVYEVSINSAGPGNSGGPLFSADGKVIGIHTYGRATGSATVSFSTPIRYGMGLMGVEPTVK